HPDEFYYGLEVRLESVVELVRVPPELARCLFANLGALAQGGGAVLGPLLVDLAAQGVDELGLECGGWEHAVCGDRHGHCAVELSGGSLGPLYVVPQAVDDDRDVLRVVAGAVDRLLTNWGLASAVATLGVDLGGGGLGGVLGGGHRLNL